LQPRGPALGRLRGSDVQVGAGSGWTADFPEASSFFGPLLTCASAKDPTGGNYNKYCNPQLDAAIDRATAIELTDPSEARRQWTAIDKQIVDNAPLVPIFDGVQSMFVSRRLGNFQQTPLGGLLFAQMWVK
jgi:peptide/nickel transport system substrate-binding protein